MESRKKIWNKAKEVIKNPERLKNLVTLSREKLNNIDQEGNFQNGDFLYKIRVMIKMMKAYLNGDRAAISKRTLLLVTFTLLYFVIPTDAIPDFIPAMGFSDDISLLYFVFKQINADVDKFLQTQT